MYNVHVGQHWTPWHLLQRNENLDLNKNLHVNVHSSFIQNGSNLEKTHIFNKQLHKQTVVYLGLGMLIIKEE